MNNTYKKSYNLINSNLHILEKSDMNCLIIISKGGLGKTTLVMNTMKSNGYELGKHYLYFNSYFTPLAFYQALAETTELKKPQILILDDVEMILKDKVILNLLKAGTWQNAGEKRIITYSSTSKNVKTQRIDFTGKIIILLNELPKKNPSFNAMVDRSLFLELQFTNEEIFDLMESEIVKKPYKNLSLNQRLKVFKFIKQNTTTGTDLSFRTIIKAFNNLLYAPNNWQELTKKSLGEQIDNTNNNLL